MEYCEHRNVCTVHIYVSVIHVRQIFVKYNIGPNNHRKVYVNPWQNAYYLKFANMYTTQKYLLSQ